MRVQFFGRLADSRGRTVELDAPPEASVGDLRALLDLADPSVRACVGDVIVADDHRPGPGEDVAFFPPVSGG